jgi:heme/copper-type cytochrome/quinol oxidase subunit 4
MSNKQRWAAVAFFLLVVLVIVPAAIAASGRVDLYYTLTAVALLSIASAGVWLTFYIGRINIGQGAYALVQVGWAGRAKGGYGPGLIWFFLSH